MRMCEILEVVRNVSSVYDGRREIAVIVIDIPSEFWYEMCTVSVNCLSRVKGSYKVVNTHSYKYPLRQKIL
jgi:hypothetical protein